MIYEIALLPVHQAHIGRFRDAFAKVAPLLRRAAGYGGHFLAQGIETPHVFQLTVQWQSLAHHTPGFEASEDHRLFMLGLQDYLAAEPSVYHIEGPTFTAGQPADLSNGLHGLMPAMSGQSVL